MRKSCIRTLIASLLIGTTMSATAFAENAVVTGSEVNIRSGPGMSYDVVGSVSRGSSVEVTDRSNGEWYAVVSGGTAGFMSSGYLDFQQSSYPATIVSTPTPATAAVSTAGQADIQTSVQVGTQTPGQITGMYVRFRSGPSSSSAILGEYSQGKAVTIYGDEGDWTYCCIDGQYGYIYSQYVSRGSASGAQATTPATAATATPTPATAAPTSPTPATAAPASSGPSILLEGGNGTASISAPAVDYSQSVIIEYPASAPAATPTPVQTPSPAVATTPQPAVATTPQPAVATTPQPAVVATPQPVVTSTPTTPASGSSSGTIAGDYVRFRKGPGTTYSILNSYDRGKAVTILGTEGEWTYCSIDGQTGYVFSQYIQPGSVSAAPSQAAANVKAPTPATAENAAPTASAAQTVASGQPAASSGGTNGYIKGNNVRFRSGPDLGADIISELYYGNAVTITGTSGTWTAIVYNGQAGYVFSQYVASGTFQNVSTGGTASGREIADYALQYVGSPYCWGGKDPSTGFDCSGFVYYVYSHFGYTLNRVASEQALNGKHIDPTDLQPGDLLCFYSGGSYIGHVGLYIGNNMFVHAATSTTGVITSELAGYYAKRGFEARRIIG